MFDHREPHVWQPGEVPIVNRSGETIPAGSLARVQGIDSTYTDFWAVYKPNAADQTRIVVVTESLPDGRRAIGYTLDHPRVINHSLGSPGPAIGDKLGTADAAWSAAAGSTLEVWAADASQAKVKLVVGGGVGGAQSAYWLADAIDGVAGTYYETALQWIYGPGQTDSIGLPAAKTGKLAYLSITWRSISGHAGGNVSFKVYNATAASDTGSPNPAGISSLAGIKAAIGGSLAVTLSDKLVVSVTGASTGLINGLIHASWGIE